MYQGEFPLLYKTYHTLRQAIKQPKTHQLLVKCVQLNFPKYFPLIPLLEFDLKQYEVHEYEGPSAFGRVFILKEILNETKEFTEPIIKIISFLFNDLMRFRSL